METLELFYPRITAQAGGYTFQQGIEIEVSSARDSRMDWAKIRFTDRFKPEISISRLEPATILLGYGGAFDEVFTGYVAKPYSTGSSANEIVLRDPMLLLEDITVNETFLDTTPQEVVRYILAQALDAVAAAWGLQVPYFFSGGIFYWGRQPEQSMIYTFEAGRNILSLARRGSLWDLETVSAPFVRHSHRVQVSHPSISGEVEVIRVRHLTNDEGFIRTHIYF